MAQATGPFERLSQNAAVAVVRRAPHWAGFDAALVRVRRAFVPSFSGPPFVDVWPVAPNVSVVTVVDAAERVTRPPARFVWGAAIGDAGEASDEELETAIDDPSAAGRMLGRFVIGRVSDEGVRLVTSPEMVHTLKHASGPGGETVATIGALAALLSGRALAVDEKAVGEFLVAGFTVGASELLDGVHTLDEASVVEVTPARTKTRSYWSLGERIAADGPSAPGALWRLARENAGRVFRSRRTRLGLTAGRDSTLLAAAAQEQAPRCLTLGPPDSPDVVGARAVAEAAGLEFVNVVRESPRSSMKRVGDYSVWADGAAIARDLVGAQWTPQLSPTIFVTGHGGEIARAFYWKTHAADERARYARSFGEVLPPKWREIARSRVSVELDQYENLAAATALDLFYARNRVRKWTCRGVRREQIVGTVHGFGDPASIRLLLNAPEEQRRNGSFFDHALALDPLQLTQVSRRALSAAQQPVATASRRNRILRVAQDPVARELLRLAASSARQSFVRRLYGNEWYAGVVRRALREDRTARTLLWNVLAVDGFAEACRDLD